MPALAGLAATAFLAPQALADPAPAQAPAQSATVADARSYASLSPEELLAAVTPATRHTAGAARAVSYTVRSGDSLSAIAGRFYHKQSAWPVLYWANHSKVRWANVLGIGQVLNIPAAPAKIPGAPAQLGPVAPAPVAASGYRSGYRSGYVSGRTYAPVQAAPVAASHYSGGSSFAQCVIARESGGNSQVMNGSGHYGLYQFSASTWAAYGGSAGSFGHASVAEQNQVFGNAMARGGQSNWAPYDGC